MYHSVMDYKDRISAVIAGGRHKQGLILHWHIGSLLIFLALSLGYAPSLFGEYNTEVERAGALHLQGNDAFDEGRYNQAIELYLQSLDFYQQYGPASSAAVVRHQLAFAHRSLGNDAKAIQYFEDNLAYHLSNNDFNSAAYYYLYAAQAYLDSGEADRALDYLHKSQSGGTAEPAWIAELAHWQVLAFELKGDDQQARAIIAESHHQLPQEAWEQHLKADSERLAVDLEAYARKKQIQHIAIWLMLGLIIFLLLLGMVKSKQIRTAMSNILLTFISIALTLVITELVLRQWLAPQYSITHHLHAPNMDTRFSPEAGVMPGVTSKVTHFTTNSAGLRGDELPSTSTPLRVIAVGGSSTEALFLDNRETWPQVMQQNLATTFVSPVWVGNAGKSGLNTFSHRVQVEYYSKELQPDLILVNAGINDLNQCISGGFQAIQDNAARARLDGFHAYYRQHVFQQIVTDPSASKIYILDLLKKAMHRSQSSEPPVKFDYVVQDQAGHFYVEQRLRRWKSNKVTVLPDINFCLDSFERNLAVMVETARQNQTSIAFITQGSLYRDDLTEQEEKLLWFGARDENPFAPEAPADYYSSTIMAQLLKQYNDRTLKVCRESSIACLDTDAVLPKTTASYYDDVHLNAQGAKKLGEMVAAFIQQEKLLTDN